MHNLNTQYDGGAYMAVTKENGQYKASLIDGRTVERDEYFDEAHLHENELLHPRLCGQNFREAIQEPRQNLENP